jgi:DNA-binding Xre family transcriptional regulator
MATAKRRPAAKKVAAKSKAKAKKPNEAIGSSLDDLLKEDGVLNQAQAEAAKRVIAWQVQKMMETQHISKAQLARDLETSRGAVDRILDSENTSMTLKSLGAIADLFGKRLEINLVDV